MITAVAVKQPLANRLYALGVRAGSRVRILRRAPFGGGLMLRNGYRLLDPGSCVGECVRDGDVIEAIPDPETLFSTFGMRRPWTG